MKNILKTILLSSFMFMLPFYGKAQTASAAYEEKLNIIQKMVGNPAPQFSAKTIDGKQVSLQNLKGKTIVVNFWFVGCQPCQEEMPLLNKLTNEYKSNPDVVFLAFASSDKGAVKAFFKKNTFNYQTIANANAIANSYNVSAYPSHFIIDKHGVIKFASIASQKDIDAFLSGKIQGVLTN